MSLPYLVVRQSGMPVLFLVFCLEIFHAFLHYRGEQTCTRHVFQDRACDEYMIDACIHLAQAVLNVCLLGHRILKGHQVWFAFSVLLLIIGSMRFLTPIVFGDVTQGTAGFYGGDFKETTGAMDIICLFWNSIMSVSLVILEDIRIPHIFCLLIAGPSVWITYCGSIPTSLVALAFVNAFSFLCLSGKRWNMKDSVKYWSNVKLSQDEQMRVQQK